MLRTALYEKHLALGARMVDFAGWAMPVLYAGPSRAEGNDPARAGGIVAEHLATREACGLFDLGHMGRFVLDGAAAAPSLDHLLSCDVAGMSTGQARYGLLLNERGCAIDDVILYRLAETRWFLVVNASNRERDFAWIRERLEGDAGIEDVGAAMGMIAVQGPKAETLTNRVLDADLSGLGYYAIHELPGGPDSGGAAVLAARTGYTGEDGFELYTSAERTARLWDRFLEAGAPEGIRPVGLGARDTLRLEAAMPLYGHELDDDTTPLEAGLGFAVRFDGAEFIGRAALARQKENGPSRRLVGFEVVGSRKVARQGYAVHEAGPGGTEAAGVVTSGSYSPTLQKNIGMAYVRSDLRKPGTELEVDVRGKRIPIRVVKRPFYKRTR